MEPLVSITLLNFNGKKTVAHSARSVFAQTFRSIEFLILEQGSTDGSEAELENLLRDAPSDCTVRYFKSSKNIGFAAGHNLLIRRARGKFILCLNSDAILSPDFIEKGLRPFEDARVAAVQGKLLRYDFDAKSPKRERVSGLPILDTAGLLVFRNRRIVNRGQGEPDQGQYEHEEEVFGADGAAPVYRKAALEDVAIPLLNQNDDLRLAMSNERLREYFDEDFFLYKEDVDLAWRLRLAGWKTIYTPYAVAYHGRGSGDSMATNPFTIIAERRKIGTNAKFLSFRNQRLMQLKNEFVSQFARDLPFILPKELASLMYVMLFEGLTLPRAVSQWMRLMPRALKKRTLVHAKTRVTPRELSAWFVS